MIHESFHKLIFERTKILYNYEDSCSQRRWIGPEIMEAVLENF